MDVLPREEVERLLFFEQAREQAQAEYRRNPKDPDNLTRLGRTLVELAQFAQGQDSYDMIEDAISKLEEAVAIDSKKHESLWWLGNAHTTQGFQTPDASAANICFQKAVTRFRQALEEDPTNDHYRKALEVSLKGPELHQEIQKQMALQQQMQAGAQGAPTPEPKASKKKKSSELGYDIAGWVILTVGVAVWLSFLSMKGGSPPAAGPMR